MKKLIKISIWEPSLFPAPFLPRVGLPVELGARVGDVRGTGAADLRVARVPAVSSVW